MKKTVISLFFAFLILGFQPLYADRYLCEVKVGYFRPFSDVLRDLYSRGWGDYQLEVSYSPFDSRDCEWWSNFFAWGSYNYIYNHGQTRSGVDDSEIDVQLYNFSGGLKYLQPMPCHFGLYGSAGARYVFLRITNRDESVDPRERAYGTGGVFSLGLLYNPYKWVLVDFYSSLMVKHFDEAHFAKDNGEEEKSVDVSGITFGVGIGFCF